MQKGCNVITIAPNSNTYDAIKLMDQHRIGSLLVLNASGKIAGIFAARDFLRKIILAGKSPQEVLVRSVMTKKVIYVTPETSVDECMAMMTEKRIRHMPVLDENGKVKGIISIGDVVKFIASEQDALIKNLVKYIDGSL